MMKFSVSVFTHSQKSYFDGQASSVILPGRDGTFETLANHKPIMSLLKEGVIIVDKQVLPFLVKRGIAMMNKEGLVVLVEAIS